jgi:hypothetical protein
MTYTPPVVNYNSGTGTTYYTLNGVQSVNISRGRQRFQDPVSQSSMVVELIPDATYSLPLAIGQLIDVRDSNADGANCYFQGQITDVERSYAFPYNSGTGYAPADRIRITATGATGVIGTRITAGYSMPSQYADQSIDDITNANGIGTVKLARNFVYNSANTINGSSLDAVNRLLRTSQLTLDDYVAPRSYSTFQEICLFPTGTQYNNISFTDTGSGYAYSNLEFLSSVQNTFNWVEVQAEGFADQIANTGVAPYNSLQYSTYSASESEAAGLASYILNLTSGQLQAAPFAISTSTATAASCMALAQLMRDGAGTANAIMGQAVSVAFRGSTYYGTVIGVNAGFYVDRANVQLYLSPSLLTPFTLDSTAFGVLDQNRLGYP